MEAHPKIAVIIVNYNVAYFLEQCLNSVWSAMQHEPAEVWVVDNNSVDGSVEMVKTKFPWVKLIANQDNRGFSYANNQAMRLSGCAYQLLLNPDTVIEETTLSQVVDYMDNNPDVGALGVRMVDGKGKFLPESKRGLPTPEVAFYKIFGLAKIFPKSKKFGQYHLSYLNEHEIHEVDILSGAFMLMRKEALDKVGLLDETFFMYGEDVDLSYRIQQGGYKNIYFPKTRIIHYKGESTKKGSVNYVFVFYRAMQIFAQKHFSSSNAKLLGFLINCAIYFRASLAIIYRFFYSNSIRIVDLTVLTIGFYQFTKFWEVYGIIFPKSVINIVLPFYVLVFFFFLLLVGAYDPPIKFKKIVQGVVLSSIAVLVVYAVLPKEFQFSRLFIGLSALFTIVYFFISRIFLHYTLKGRFILNGKKAKNFVIIASKTESQRIAELLKLTQQTANSLFFVEPEFNAEKAFELKLENLKQIVEIHKIDEVIFSSSDTSSAEIISWMIKLSEFSLDFKIAQPDSTYLIGSNSIETAGDVYMLNINSLDSVTKQRQKRVFDIVVSSTMFLFFIYFIWFYTNKLRWIKNCLDVLVGARTCVGFGSTVHAKMNQLPKLKRGILHPSNRFEGLDENLELKLDLIYAREYSIIEDLKILLSAWKKFDS